MLIVDVARKRPPVSTLVIWIINFVKCLVAYPSLKLKNRLFFMKGVQSVKIDFNIICIIPLLLKGTNGRSIAADELVQLCKKSTKSFVKTADWQWMKCLQCFHEFPDLCYMKQLQKLWDIENCVQDGSQNNW